MQIIKERYGCRTAETKAIGSNIKTQREMCGDIERGSGVVGIVNKLSP